MSANGATPPPAAVAVPAVVEKPTEAPRELAVASTVSVTTPDDGSSVNPFAGAGSFALAQRMAMALASSSMVPKEYQGNTGNCLIAIELAARIGMPAFMVMQNMVPIYGKPSWTSKFLIGIVNSSSEWTAIRWRWTGNKADGDDWGVRAYATDKRTGDECVGPFVDIAMAKAEGWHDRNGSKWLTMPEVMLMYRSAAFWSRMYAPEKTLGLTTEEQEDIGGTVRPDPIDVKPSVPAVTTSKTLADVTARSKEERQANPTPATPATPPTVTSVTTVSTVTAAKKEAAPKGQASLPVGKPARRVSVTMADGTPVNLDNDEDAVSRAAVAPTAKEIAANGPPPIREPGSDDDN